MKKHIFAFLLMLMCLTGVHASMTADVRVNSSDLTWDRVEGASYYDLYLDGAPLARLRSDATGYTLSHLDQMREYTVIMGARDRDGNTLHADKVTFQTGSFSGTYRFVNDSDDDNHGKLRMLEFRAELAEGPDGQYMAISYPVEGVYIPFFPFEPYDGPWDWVKFRSDLPLARVYKDICSRINRLDIMPTSFRIDGFDVTTDTVIMRITSKAYGIKVSTVTEFNFRSDESGTYAVFRNSGSDLIEKALFRGDDPDDPYAFRLEKVD